MAYCPSCGHEIAADDRFCRACGKDLVQDAPPAVEQVAAVEPEAIVNEAVEQSSPAPAPTPSPEPRAKGGRRWLVPVIVIAVVAIAAAGGVILIEKNASHNRAVKAAAAAAAAKAHAAKVAEIASEKAAATSALDPFKKLDSALTVGVVFADYGTYTQNAQYALDSYTPTDATGRQVLRSLTNAMKLFAGAGDAWNDTIQMKFSGDKATGAYWVKHYPGLQGVLDQGQVTATKVEQAAWAAAGLQVAAAEASAQCYSSP